MGRESRAECDESMWAKFHFYCYIDNVVQNKVCGLASFCRALNHASYAGNNPEESYAKHRALSRLIYRLLRYQLKARPIVSALRGVGTSAMPGRATG